MVRSNNRHQSRGCLAGRWHSICAIIAERFLHLKGIEWLTSLNLVLGFSVLPVSRQAGASISGSTGEWPAVFVDWRPLANPFGPQAAWETTPFRVKSVRRRRPEHLLRRLC
jgi:hypothetical protein